MYRIFVRKHANTPITRRRARRRLGLSNTLYLIIAKTYQRYGIGERDGQHDKFQNCYIFVACRASCCAGFRVTTTISPCSRKNNCVGVDDALLS